MSTSPRLSPSPPEAAYGKVAGRLEHARTRLEERFLEGGAVLAAALDSVSEMIASLDQVTAALGQDTVDATIADLDRTANRLLGLPEVHAARQESMHGLMAHGVSLRSHVDDMLETLRYLRTFAVTVKITGAGAAEFAGFADEMLAKIQSGRDEVDDFAVRLGQLLGQVGAASGFGEDLRRQYDGIVPGVTRDLARDAARMGAYHGEVRRVAAALADLVRQVQGKVAKVLSALQIGDMTRQRVEHVQAGLEMLAAAQADGPVAGGVVLRLLAAQMEDLLDEFHAGCGTVTSSLAGLAGDTKEILALGRQARGGGSGGGEGFLRALEAGVGAARGLVGRGEAANARTGEVSRSAIATARDLTNAVGTIRAIKSEIQYMAINTSLRCSRLGDVGKPMNVVASELRVFAEQMETVSGRILEGLETLSSMALGMSGEESDGAPALGQALDSALANIREAGERMGRELKELAARGEHVARDVSQSVARLDFTRELGEVLEECTVSLEAEAADAARDAGSTDEALAASVCELSERLFATYTMARERQVHRLHIPAEATMVDETAAGAPAQEEDELSAVLF